MRQWRWRILLFSNFYSRLNDHEVYNIQNVVDSLCVYIGLYPGNQKRIFYKVPYI